ncbi:hypothetical protein TcWFU_001758 [Taenia crassiceps]|uniref:Tetraspanin n=1 Tax=Taenia crassiceps TaxID=6207 RepID=A0ABR4Q3B3_9CEST
MNCLLGCSRLILAFLNLLLFIAFAAVGVVGLMLKYNSKFLYSLLEKATTQWPQKEMQDVVQFIQQYGSGLAMGFIVLGFAVAIVALIGLFALFYKNRFLGFIYIALLSILAIIELALIIYLFAIPGNLDKAAFKALNSSFEHLRTNDSLTAVTYSLWSVLGSAGNKFCCGLKGYVDFEGLYAGLPYPPPCCGQNITTTDIQPPLNQHCNKTLAEAQKVEGCKDKVVEFLKENKSLFMGISCGVLLFHILVLLQRRFINRVERVLQLLYVTPCKTERTLSSLKPDSAAANLPSVTQVPHSLALWC